MQHHHLPGSLATGPFGGRFLRGSGEDEATAPTPGAAASGVTQVMNANWLAHGSLRNNVFTCI